MSILQGLQSNYRILGAYGLLLVAKSRLNGKPKEIVVTVDGISSPIHLRLRTTDISLLEEIILNDEYQFEPSKTPKVIIDAGANIGLTSIYYANKYPNAKIISIEPEQSNYEMLKQNCAYYTNIIAIQGALWREEAMLDLSNPGTGNWGFQTQIHNEGDALDGSVPGMTIATLLENYGFNYIDILKVDIEGSEKEVFETSQSWIDKVGVIIVELHDHFKNGCSRSVYSATNNFELEWRKGETNFFLRKEYAPRGATNNSELPMIDLELKKQQPRPRIISVHS